MPRKSKQLLNLPRKQLSKYLKDGSERESVFQKKIIQALKLSGYLVYKQNVFSGFVDGRFVSSGIPVGASDLVALAPPYGIVLFIELKSGKGKQRDDQKIFQNEVESRGGIYMLISSKIPLTECLRMIRLEVEQKCERIAFNNKFILTNAQNSSRKK